jgi:hypothetical protein
VRPIAVRPIAVRPVAVRPVADVAANATADRLDTSAAGSSPGAGRGNGTVGVGNHANGLPRASSSGSPQGSCAALLIATSIHPNRAQSPAEPRATPHTAHPPQPATSPRLARD